MNAWISVEDRLPDEMDDVLVCGAFLSGEFCPIWYIAYLSAGIWNLSTEDIPMESFDIKIFHWMPLPEPLKETA